MLRFRPEARDDIKAIALIIAEDRPNAAAGWVEDVQAKCRLLASMPRMGRAVNDVRPGLRLFPIGNYLILYREIDGGAEIVRVIHGARDWQNLV